MQTKTIIRRATRNVGDPLNIICAATFERTEALLAQKTNHTFWSIQSERWKRWNHAFAKPPSNYILLNDKKDIREQLPPWVSYDLVLSQNRMAQFPVMKQIANYFNIPLITCEHMSATPDTSEIIKRKMREMEGDANIFVTSLVRDSWGWPSDFGQVIHNSIDLDLFKRDEKIEKQGYVLSIHNDWVNRDVYCGFQLWAQTVGYPDNFKFPVKVVGDTRGLSEPAKDVHELVKAYNEASVYLNTTLVSSLPTVLLEAAACEIPIVSTNTTVIPRLLVQHKKTGFISQNNDPKELTYYCNLLLNDPSLCKKMGKAGRKLIEERFNTQKFIDNYEKVFQETAQIRK